MVWLKLLASVVIILIAGVMLSRYGDIIAEKSRLGRVWIGMVLIASVTTMPELVTSLSATTLVGKPDLAIGALLGSCIYNLSILAILDIIFRGTPVLSRASPKHILSASIGIGLFAVAGVGIFVLHRVPGLTAGWIGIPSLILIVIYLVGARETFRRNRVTKETVTETIERYASVSSRSVYVSFALTALVIIGAGVWLSFIGDEISVTTGLGASFVGSLFIAIATSLPELAVTISAVRIGATDLALGDILGANMLDVLAIAWSDLAYNGNIFAVASPVHAMTATLAAVMTIIVIIGLKYPQQRKTFAFMSWYSPLFIALYIFGAYYLFTYSFGTG